MDSDADDHHRKLNEEEGLGLMPCGTIMYNAKLVLETNALLRTQAFVGVGARRWEGLACEVDMRIFARECFRLGNAGLMSYTSKGLWEQVWGGAWGGGCHTDGWLRKRTHTWGLQPAHCMYGDLVCLVVLVRVWASRGSNPKAWVVVNAGELDTWLAGCVYEDLRRRCGWAPPPDQAARGQAATAERRQHFESYSKADVASAMAGQMVEEGATGCFVAETRALGAQRTANCTLHGKRGLGVPVKRSMTKFMEASGEVHLTWAMDRETLASQLAPAWAKVLGATHKDVVIICDKEGRKWHHQPWAYMDESGRMAKEASGVEWSRAEWHTKGGMPCGVSRLLCGLGLQVGVPEEKKKHKSPWLQQLPFSALQLQTTQDGYVRGDGSRSGNVGQARSGIAVHVLTLRGVQRPLVAAHVMGDSTGGEGHIPSAGKDVGCTWHHGTPSSMVEVLQDAMKGLGVAWGPECVDMAPLTSPLCTEQATRDGLPVPTKIAKTMVGSGWVDVELRGPGPSSKSVCTD